MGPFVTAVILMFNYYSYPYLFPKDEIMSCVLISITSVLLILFGLILFFTNLEGELQIIILVRISCIFGSSTLFQEKEVRAAIFTNYRQGPDSIFAT